MGNSSSDSYFIEKPAVAAAALKRGCSFYWIDFNINTHENRAYLQILSEVVLVYPFDKWEGLVSTINGLPSNPSSKICVISSSSLPPEAYTWLQAEKKIDKMMLFCGSVERAAPIIAANPKIASCSTNLEDLILEIRLTQVEDTQSMLFFSVADVGQLNSWMHNWFALQQSVVRERGKEHFKQLLATIHGNGTAGKYDKEYILGKGGLDRQNMVLEWVKANNYFFQIPTEMLTKVRDTFCLALVRQPLFDIYNSLKTSYASENHPEMSVYVKLCLNAYEIVRLKAGIRYFYFSTFLVCDTNPVGKSAHKNEFTITLKLKQKASSMDFMESGGFFWDEASRRVFLNIDIPFEVLQADMEKRELVVQMVHVPRGDIEQPEVARLQLHRKFIRYMGKILPGQLLPSHHNGQLGAYYDQLKSEVDFLQETTNVDVYRKCMRKLQMAKIKLYYHLEDEDAIQDDVMKAKDLVLKIQNEKDAVAAKIKVYLLLMEIYMRLNNLLKFARCNTRLKQIYDQFSADFSEEEANKQKLYNFYCAMASNKCQIREFMEKVRQIEDLCSTKQREDAHVSELFFLIVITKAKGEELLGNIPRALALFDELLEDIQTCQGHNQVYRYYAALKDSVRDRQLNRVKQIEQEQIKKKIDCKVPLQSLSYEPLKISFRIEEGLFGGIDNSQLIN